MLVFSKDFVLYLHRGVEQLVARRAHNPKVASSSLVPATKEDFSASGLLSLFSFSTLPSDIELISSKIEFECVVRYSFLLGASLIPFGNTSF